MNHLHCAGCGNSVDVPFHMCYIQHLYSRDTVTQDWQVHRYSKQCINSLCMFCYTQVLHMCLHTHIQRYVHSVSLERCKAEGTSWDRKVKQDTWSQKCFIRNSASLVRPRPNPSVPGLRSTSYLPQLFMGCKTALESCQCLLLPWHQSWSPWQEAAQHCLHCPNSAPKPNHSCSALLYEPSLGAESVPTHSNSRFNRFVTVDLTAPLIPTLRTQEASNLFLLNLVLRKL